MVEHCWQKEKVTHNLISNFQCHSWFWTKKITFLLSKVPFIWFLFSRHSQFVFAIYFFLFSTILPQNFLEIFSIHSQLKKKIILQLPDQKCIRGPRYPVVQAFSGVGVEEVVTEFACARSTNTNPALLGFVEVGRRSCVASFLWISILSKI